MFNDLSWFEYIIGGVIGLLIIALISVLIMALIEAYRPTFELKKDAWHCEQSHKETHLVMIGKVLMPRTDNVCTQWNAN